LTRHGHPLVGPVGTPTCVATHAIAKEAGVPFIGPFTGAEGLRNPYQPHIVDVRASYFQETEVMVEHLTKDRGVTKIAILYQDDTFGQAGLAGTRRAMQKRSMQLGAEGTFERNTVNVSGGLESIRKGAPQAVIMIGPCKPRADDSHVGPLDLCERGGGALQMPTREIREPADVPTNDSADQPLDIVEDATH
jgi:ABC-type branched-subunit amino acid transport system substrate-binding protein